jgi:hypothetical protein
VKGWHVVTRKTSKKQDPLKNLYPIWNSKNHGPPMSGSDLGLETQEPNDLIHFTDEENLVARLRMLGWDEIASQLDGHRLEGYR